MEDLSKYILASLSHDVRSPLSFALKAANRLELALTENQPDLAMSLTHRIVGSLARIAQRIEELNNFSQIYLAGHTFKPAEVDLCQLVEHVERTLADVFAANKNTVRTDMAAEAVLVSNGPLLSIVLHNILYNASKHCIGSDIMICVAARGGVTRISVLDNGPGMPGEIARWLTGEDENLMHMGIGLILVKKISAYLGAKIQVSVLDGTHVSLVFG